MTMTTSLMYTDHCHPKNFQLYQKNTVKNGRNSQKGGWGGDVWKKFPNNPVFFLVLSLYGDVYDVHALLSTEKGLLCLEESLVKASVCTLTKA